MTNFLVFPEINDENGFPPPVNRAILLSPEAQLVITESTARNAAEQVPPLVEQAIAADPTVANAAAVAVTAEIAGRDLVEGFDIVEESITFAVVDEDGRRGFIEQDSAGKPTNYSASLIVEKIGPTIAAEVGIKDMNTAINGLGFSVVDEDDRRTELEVGEDGRLTQRVIDSIASRITITPEPLPLPVIPEPHILSIGHSMMAGVGGALSSALNAIGWTAYSIAVGGESMNTVSARLGSHPTYVLFPGGEIPPSGSATITVSSDAADALIQGPSSYAVTLLTLDGTKVRGTFSKPGGNFTFTRTTDGVAIPTARPIQMVYDVSQSRRSKTFLFWAGRNGSWTSENAVKARLERMEGMIRHQRALFPRFLVISEHKTSNDTPEVKAAIDDYNRQAYLLWGDRFIDSQQYLIEYGLADRGLTPTTQDATDISGSIVPESLRSDAIHLNTNGNSVVAAMVVRRIIEMEW